MKNPTASPFRSFEMVVLGAGIGALIEIYLRGQKKCPLCAPCAATDATPSGQLAPNASQVPR